MTTVGLYGNSSSGVVAAASGSESTGLYGNNTSFGGSYFEWFIFQQSDTQPATPTGGSWSFTTNSGTPPTGWSVDPPSAPTNKVWVSIALVSSKAPDTLTWSAPGLFSYASGLPILSGSGAPLSGLGQSDQLYIQLDTTPQTIWFKESGTWTRLTGSSLYVDLTSNQTIAGTKTFSSQIQGSISGTASNVTGVVGITNGGTGATTASGARTALGLGTAATQDSTAFATAAQGTKADTAIQTITSTDGSVTIGTTGTTRDLSVAVAAATNNVICQVRNTTGATLTKGTVVYISGATGQLPTVSKALATSDATSAQTLGMMSADLANNSNGNVTIIGLITNIDTSAYTDGQQLYLSGTTAGTVTATKPYAPIHLVYVAVVEYAHPVNGKLFVKVQNGYELDELHNVKAQTPSNGQTIVYNSSNSLWENNTVSLTLGVNGTLPVANGGTGQTTANAAFNALAPSQTGNSGKYLTTDGSNTSWATNPLGTVTSVAMTVPSFLSVSGSPITSSGTLAVSLSGTALPTANGGTGLTSFTANGVVYASSTSALTTGSALTFDGSTVGAFGGSTVNYRFNANRGTDDSSQGLRFGYAGLDSYRSGVSLALPQTPLNFTQTGSDGTRTPYYIDVNGNSIWSPGSGTSPSEQMRLTSTGLGIGTSSPGYKLSVSGASSGVAAALGYNGDAGTNLYVGVNHASNLVQLYASGSANKSLAFYTGSTEVMRYDYSGNLGLGVTSPSGRFQASSGASPNYAGVLVGYSSTSVNYYDANTQIFRNGAYSEGMRLDSSGNLGIGTSSPAVKLQVYDAGNTYSGTFGSVGGAQIVALGNSAGIATIQGFSNSSFAAYSDLALQSGGGNLGIGTSSPSYKLDVAGPINIQGTSTFPVTGMMLRSGDNQLKILGGSAGIVFGAPSGASSYATIDSSGNLGLGVTPSAWGSGYTALQVKNASIYGFSSYETAYSVNAFYNGSSWRYISSTNASRYDQVLGQHAWYTAGSGTAGSAISFTQAMTLDASGNLLVGTTSIYGAGYRMYLECAAGSGGIAIKNSISTGVPLEFLNSSGTEVGSVTTTNTLTAYNVASDYRLKNITGPLTNSGAYIDSLNPVEGTWKADGSTFIGLIAHEVQESSRTPVVTGVKDGEKMQSMDYSSSEIIANLIAEVKSLRARLAAAGI